MAFLCNYREDPNSQCWFEETLCHIASLYALRRMPQVWQTKAPYPKWISYAFNLKKCAENDMKKTIVEWYLKHQKKIEQIDHRSISYIVLKLLPVLEQDPSAWQVVRYINLGPKEENQSLEKCFSGWHDRVPLPQQSFVRKMAKEFGIFLA